MNGCEDVGPWAGRPRAEMMKSDEVEAMLHLHALGWGLKRIAREFGCSKNTVRRYVAADGWMAYSRPVRGGKLEAQEAWLKECFFRHRGNAEVVRQDLLRELSIDVSLRTVERAVAPFRRLLTAEAKATVRFETAPGLRCSSSCATRRSKPPTGGPSRPSAPRWSPARCAAATAPGGGPTPSRCWPASCVPPANATSTRAR